LRSRKTGESTGAALLRSFGQRHADVIAKDEGTPIPDCRIAALVVASVVVRWIVPTVVPRIDMRDALDSTEEERGIACPARPDADIVVEA
jgi:hypothetical protein